VPGDPETTLRKSVRIRAAALAARARAEFASSEVEAPNQAEARELPAGARGGQARPIDVFA